MGNKVTELMNCRGAVVEDERDGVGSSRGQALVLLAPLIFDDEMVGEGELVRCCHRSCSSRSMRR